MPRQPARFVPGLLSTQQGNFGLSGRHVSLEALGPNHVDNHADFAAPGFQTAGPAWLRAGKKPPTRLELGTEILLAAAGQPLHGQKPSVPRNKLNCPLRPIVNFARAVISGRFCPNMMVYSNLGTPK